MGAANPARLVLVVNERPVASVPTIRAADHILVPIDAVARAAGVHARRAGHARILEVDGDSLSILPNDTIVRVNGLPGARLAVSPIERGGALYVAVGDLPELLAVSYSVQGDKLVLSAPSENGSVQIIEKRVERTPHPPIATPPPALPLSAQAKNYARVSLTLQKTPGDRSQDLYADLHGATIQGDGDFATGNGSISGSGIVTVGTADRSATVGGVGDPLQGIVFRSGQSSGERFVNAPAGVALSSATRQEDARHILALTQQRGDVSHEIAVVAQGQAFDQVLLGLTRKSALGWGTLNKELWLGDRGAAAGLAARSQGRFFVDAALSAASSGMPLKPGDAPLHVGVGDKASNWLTLQGGIFAGRGSASSPYAGAAFDGRYGSLALTDGASGKSLDAHLKVNRASAEVLAFASDGTSTLLMMASSPTRTGALELSSEANATGPYSDATLQWRSFRPGLAPVVGFEAIHSGGLHRAGLVLGVSVPLTSTVALDIAMHPLTGGNGVRVRLSKLLVFRSAQDRMKSLNVQTEGAGSAPLQIEIDGRAVKKFSGTSTTIDVPAAGNHYVSVASLDGALASPSVRTSTISGRQLSLPLWPVRSVVGHVQTAGPLVLFAGQSLAGLTIVLLPANVITATDANGAFVFPVQPIEPGSQVTVDASSLPSGFVPGSPTLVTDQGPITIDLLPTKKVERQVFVSPSKS